MRAPRLARHNPLFFLKNSFSSGQRNAGVAFLSLGLRPDDNWSGSAGDGASDEAE